jgi:serine/threonine protein kinase
MWTGKSFSLTPLGIEGTYTIPQIPLVDIHTIPYYSEKQKSLLSTNHMLRASLQFESQVDHGSYGNIYMAKRNAVPVLVKQPRMAEMNLFQEAILQHLAQKTLEVEGIPWAIPVVYDVFWKGKEIWFSMEQIHGITVQDWFVHTQTPDRDTFFLLAQLCLILATLESHLNLDHRDLKTSNLLLKPYPCTLKVKLKDHVWSLQSPFTVVVLDFGFACLGSEVLRGKPWVNLGDGVLPPMDPCPKEGRDMFHLLVSLLGLPIFREKISPSLHERFDTWLRVGKKSYGTMARRWSTENWSYLVSSEPTFSIPKCCPLAILQDILPELKDFLHRA